MVAPSKISLDFDQEKLLFHDEYPEELLGIVAPEEFDAVLRTINTEIGLKIQASNESIRKWIKIVDRTLIILVGFLLSPILLMKLSNQKKHMEEYWVKVKEYLYHQNKKTYLKRGIEWKLEVDRAKIKGRDAVNPLACNMISILYEPKNRRVSSSRIVAQKKSIMAEKRKSERQFSKLPGIGEENESADTVTQLSDVIV